MIDTHTGGEPTRVVVGGGPDLGPGLMVRRRDVFRARFDPFRSAVVDEPRGSDVMVGALVCEPEDPSHAAGVIFFNNVGFLNMCGHGTIGVAVALVQHGRIAPGRHTIETPVGNVDVTIEDDGNTVALDNVESRRSARGVAIEVPGVGRFTGDVAWGGNWFFLVEDHEEELALANVERLTEVTWGIRRALVANGITGDDGGEIDHIELFGPPSTSEADGKSFVLCPGKAYDRSPCGTGTSAKVACLVADGKLREGQVWRQESIVGSVFEASARVVDGRVYPRIRGSAYVNAMSTLILDPADPFRMGIRA
ncbi:MAG TPA: proline racemase family protein [Isosphaeraceae bacterium]|nr:proline racemase family protein [Isosphaeraceae bacterium]